MRPATVKSGIVCLLVLNSALEAQSPLIDLRQWGYTQPPPFRKESFPLSSLLAFDSRGDVLVGFTMRAGDALATREQPALSLQVVKLSNTGRFLSQLGLPTTAWVGNSIFVTSSGNLLLRTPDELTLYSATGKILARRAIADRRAFLHVLPGQQRAVLDEAHTVELFQLETLATVKKCMWGRESSFSANNALITFPQDYASMLRPFRLAVSEICGPTQFTYEWGLLPGGGEAILLDDRRFITIGQKAIELVDRDTPQWRDSLHKSTLVHSFHTREVAGRFPLIAARYVGGSLAFDINGCLQSAKAIVYRTSDGKHLAEVPIQHPGKPPFRYPFDFALSPDGSLLAVLSDGFVQLTRIGDASNSAALAR
jgi:hypothetical protein